MEDGSWQPCRDCLKGLLESLKGYVMSPEEKEEQRRCFAYGNVAMHNPEVTRELVDWVTDRMNKR